MEPASTTSAPAAPAGLLGGIGLTHLTVYTQRPGPDGAHSGCAHVHAITDEAYYVIAGEGALELHDLAHGYRRQPLQAGSFVQFPPGTLHRSVSTSGLEVLAVMTNAGLAERGDARIYFGREVDDDPAEFERLVRLPQREGLEGALARRDASVRAYARLLALWERDRPAYFSELARFVSLHRAAALSRRTQYADIVRDGPQAWADLARRRLLADESVPAGAIACGEAPEPPRLGMCGLLRPVHTTAL